MGKTPIYGIDGRGVCSPGRICSEVELHSPAIRADSVMEVAGNPVSVEGHEHVELAEVDHGHVTLAAVGHVHSEYSTAGHSHTHSHAEYALVAHTHAATIAAGTNTVPTLGAGASTTVSVTIKPTLPSTSYTVAAFLLGGVNLLGNLQVTGTAVISTSQVNVTVQNTGILSLGGASVCVIAIMNA